MTTKKKAQPKGPLYIAIDTTSDYIIGIGSKQDVLEGLQAHCDFETFEVPPMDEQTIISTTKVYELGEELNINVKTTYEINF